MFFVGLISLAALSLSGSCPPDALPPPCVCSPIGFKESSVTCKSGDNEIDLQKSIQRMKSALPIRDFFILESTFNFMPSSVFQGLKIPTLFIGGCTLSSFSDTDKAFEGLEDSLEILKVHETTLLDGWEWSQLRDLHALREIHAVKAGPLSVDDDIKDIAHLNIKKLSLTRSSLSHLHDTAFSTFHNLEVLSLKDNAISTIKRTMFPNPAAQLTMLILSQNQLDSLPDDLFTNMPALRSIILYENRFMTLKQEIFQPVWNNLKTFDVAENPLRCDCRLSWVAKVGKMPMNTRGSCLEPQELKGRKITDLQTADLWC